MRVTIVPAAELDPPLLAQWECLQENDARFANPFFRPELTTAVAAVRSDAFVAVLEDAERVAGFFPFHRSRLGVGTPIGGARSNYHGAIVEPGLEWTATELVRACGLSVFDFHHLLAEQQQFLPHCTRTAPSSYVDLSAGFPAYRAARAAAGSEVVPQTERKARKLAREVGPLRFEPLAADPDLLRLLLRWKSDQYRRTGMIDTFALRWNVQLIERIHQTSVPGFAGMLSVLYAGDRVVALLFGLRSRDVWHVWFPAYARELSRYSPGMILMLRMVQASESLGLRLIDFGKDDAVYKSRFGTGSFMVTEGTVLVPSLVASARRAQRRAAGAIKGTSLEGPVRAARRLVRTRLAAGTGV
jgi:CelD/BcsL family acetyltransferase involved in cellulose biosynthesis